MNTDFSLNSRIDYGLNLIIDIGVNFRCFD